MIVSIGRVLKTSLATSVRYLHQNSTVSLLICKPVSATWCGQRSYSMTVPDPEFPTLMNPHQVQRKLDESKNVRVLDCSWHFPSSGRDPLKEYQVKHIAGAQFFDIGECADKSSHLSHMLPIPRVFEDYVGERGINNDTHVIVYDTSEMGMFSCQRVWWTFRVFGHEMVSILNGGLVKWEEESHPLTDVVPSYPREEFVARLRPGLIKCFEDVEANLAEQEFVVVDARSPGRFEGREPEPREGKPVSLQVRQYNK